MKTCGHCGKQIDEALTICPHCGAEQEPEKLPVSKQAVLSFILSFILPLAPVSILLALVSIFAFSKTRRVGFAVASLIVTFILFMAVWVFKDQVMEFLTRQLSSPSIPSPDVNIMY